MAIKFSTPSPFTTTKWPQIAPKDQEVILELVYNLIAPLGERRRKHSHHSRGRKRKRDSTAHCNHASESEAPPLELKIGKHILVGLNSVTRHLEALAARNAPSTVPAAQTHKDTDGSVVSWHSKLAGEGNNEHVHSEKEEIMPLSMVILTHPEPSRSLAHAHLPTLVHIAALPASHTGDSTCALAASPDSAIRFIPLASSTEGRLASALHIPRAGALAITQNAPGIEALEAFVRSNVQPTQCQWIDEAFKAQWRGLAGTKT